MNRRTINVALEEGVGLSLRRLRTRPFPINFVLDIAHHASRTYEHGPNRGRYERGIISIDSRRSPFLIEMYQYWVS